MKFIYFLPILASSFAQAENLPVIPDIQGYGTYEFGVIVKKLMPKEQHVWWDYLSNEKNIKWLTSGSKEIINYDGSIESSRQGLVRINVLGNTPAILRVNSHRFCRHLLVR